MPALSEQQAVDLLQPYLAGLETAPDLYAKSVTFLDLLLRWNARTNLTAIREPAQLLQRQIGESLFAARLLQGGGNLLDVGSGAGFPGIPLKLILPNLKVTLAESQGKKASFLQEASRVLGLDIVVWPQRVELVASDQVFQWVTMRAVDNTSEVLDTAASRVARGGSLLRYIARQGTAERDGWVVTNDLAVPLSAGRLVRLVRPAVFHVEQ